MSDTENMSEQETTANKTTARIVGALIIVGYAVYGIPEGTILQPILGASDLLTNVAAHTTQLTTGALIMAINSFAVVGIGVLLFPILKQHNETIALGYLVTRVFEALLMMVGIIGVLLLVPLSQEYVQATAADTASLQAISTVALAGNDLAYQIAMIGLSIGSLPFCYLLYQSQLVPRVISLLGLAGYPALLILMVIETFGFGGGPAVYILIVPGMLFEIGLALWLIIKGFDSSTIASESANSLPQVQDPITQPQQPRED